MISVRFQGKPFNITVIQFYVPTSNAEEAEVEWFYEDLQDLLELIPPKDVLFIIEDWNAKVGSQETPGSEVKSEVAQSCPTLCDPMDCSLPGSSVQGFSRQEYWSGLPFPSPRDLPNPGIKPRSPALQTDTLPFEPPGKHLE